MSPTGALGSAAGAPPAAAPRRAGAEDRSAIVDTLTAAFAEDPVLAWAYPRRRSRLRNGRRLFGSVADRLVPQSLTWTVDGGAALWATHDGWREPPLEAARLAVASLAGVWPHPWRTARGWLALEGKHPSAPHLFLATLGVRPDRQGQGLGSRLIEPGVAEADARGLPCYLESSNERNVPLYERFGFQVFAVHHMPAGPPLWLMWRDAAG